MPRPVEISEADIHWLQTNFDMLHISEVADRFGCCVDTAKRICARHGIGNYDGAKYVPTVQIQMWERPCTCCGDTTPRPKWQYRCNRCKSHEDVFGLDEQWIY